MTVPHAGGGAEVAVDAGPGTFASLQRHTDPARLTMIRMPAAPVPVYAPQDRARRPAGFRAPVGLLKGVIDFRPRCDGHDVRHRPLRLTDRADLFPREADLDGHRGGEHAEASRGPTRAAVEGDSREVRGVSRQPGLPLPEALTQHGPPPTFDASYSVRHI